MSKRFWFGILSGTFSALAMAFLLTGFGPHTNAVPGGAQVSPSPSQSYDSRILLKDFQAAQQNQLKAFLAKEKTATKDLKNLQTSKQKEFDAREKIARRKFFADERPGTEKRAYMHDLLARRDAFRKEQADERAKAKDDSDRRTREFKEEQADHLSKFKDALSRGERPSDTLWPQPGT